MDCRIKPRPFLRPLLVPNRVNPLADFLAQNRPDVDGDKEGTLRDDIIHAIFGVRVAIVGRDSNFEKAHTSA